MIVQQASTKMGALLFLEPLIIFELLGVSSDELFSLKRL